MKLETALTQSPVVAIVRGIRPDEALAHVEALFASGVRAVEVPLNSPSPLESIRKIVDTFGARMVVGAGTVLSAEAVDAVAAVGARLIVSPNSNVDVVSRALELGLEPAPGFATATEAFLAYNAGARHLKLFPAVTYGPGYLRQLKAVLPLDAMIWAVGGVGPATMSDWWAAGARAFGLGGELYRAGQTVDETRANAVAAIKAAAGLA